MTVIIDTPRASRTVTVRLGTFTQRRRRDITTPAPPPHPDRSADLRILRAWVEAEVAQSERPHDSRCPTLRDDEAECLCGRSRLVIAAVETAVRQASSGASRRALGRHYHEIPAQLRPLFGQGAGVGLKRLLGDWMKGGFEPGLADLTEREAEAYWLRLRGWSATATACEMTPSKQRHDRRLWLSVQTVYNYTHQAKVKVLRTFGLPEAGEDDDDLDFEA